MIRLGVVGLGAAGRLMLAAAQRSDAVTVAAVADLDPARLAAAAVADDVARIDDLTALGRRDDVDVAYVATPTPAHRDHVVELLRAGKHVVVEKPIAATLADADTMIVEAARAGRTLIVGSSHSFDAPIVAIRSIVESGELGRLRMISTMCWTDWMQRPRLDADLDPRRGGGVVLRQGAHQFDIVRYIAGGLARSIRAHVAGDPDGTTPHAAYAGVVAFDGGVTASVVYDGLGGLDGRLLSFGAGEAGELVGFGGLNGLTRSAPPGSANPTFGQTIVRFDGGVVMPSPAGILVFRDGAPEARTLTGPSGWDAVLVELTDALGGALPEHDGRWGKATLELCLAAAESSATGTEVTLRDQVALGRPAASDARIAPERSAE